MDWNSDGKKDLIMGERDGYIRIYLNGGTDAAPVFKGFKYLQVDGSTFDCGLSSIPEVTDWNNDGKKDLLVGEDDGGVLLLINMGTNEAPLFVGSTFIQSNGSDIDVGMLAHPAVFDWNGDDKKDLIVGELSGYLNYYENIGTDAYPQFSGYTLLRAGGQTIDVSYDAHPKFVDWDNNGVMDIVCGNRDIITGHILYFQALGPLSVDENMLSRSTGGTIRFALDAGLDHAGRNYFLLGSRSGTDPGTTLPGGATLPLNQDGVMQFILNNYNRPMLTDFRGTLDTNGEAVATLNAASLPLAAGTILHFAWTTESPYDFQSNPVPVEVVP